MISFKNMFTWWEGVSLGTALFSWRNGVKVGSDALGNIYYRAKKGDRRWVIYSGSNDSRVFSGDWLWWMVI